MFSMSLTDFEFQWTNKWIFGDFGIQKHSPFIFWQRKDKLFKLHFSTPFQILSGNRNIYTHLKQKNKECT